MSAADEMVVQEGTDPVAVARGVDEIAFVVFAAVYHPCAASGETRQRSQVAYRDCRVRGPVNVQGRHAERLGARLPRSTGPGGVRWPIRIGTSPNTNAGR